LIDRSTQEEEKGSKTWLSLFGLPPPLVSPPPFFFFSCYSLFRALLGLGGSFFLHSVCALSFWSLSFLGNKCLGTVRYISRCFCPPPFFYFYFFLPLLLVYFRLFTWPCCPRFFLVKSKACARYVFDFVLNGNLLLVVVVVVDSYIDNFLFGEFVYAIRNQKSNCRHDWLRVFRCVSLLSCYSLSSSWGKNGNIDCVPGECRDCGPSLCSEAILVGGIWRFVVGFPRGMVRGW